MKPDGGQCVRVSLTGAVSSQRVTEEREAWLSMVGNYASSVWVEARLTVRRTCRADAIADMVKIQSDPCGDTRSQAEMT